MSDPVTVELGKYDSIDGIHCGVTIDYQVTCGGNTTVLENDGDEFTFDRHGITVKRNESDVTFTK
ncbi:MAG: hypothetical protein V3U71_01735 [Cocleimonas sp.]